MLIRDTRVHQLCKHQEQRTLITRNKILPPNFEAEQTICISLILVPITRVRFTQRELKFGELFHSNSLTH